MAYLSGPKNVACTPSPNSTTKHRTVLGNRSPAAAPAISRTSAAFAATMQRALSNLSAIWPAVAENRT